MPKGLCGRPNEFKLLGLALFPGSSDRSEVWADLALVTAVRLLDHEFEIGAS
jgi:hypothetical protein